MMMDDKPLSPLIILACASMIFLVLHGCASNSQVAIEKTYNEDGTPASELTVKGKTVSTWGSKTEEGAGNFRYSGDSEKFEMETGNHVSGQEAGSADQGQRSAPQPQPQPEPEPQPEPIPDIDPIELILRDRLPNFGN